MKTKTEEEALSVIISISLDLVVQFKKKETKRLIPIGRLLTGERYEIKTR